MGQGSASSLVFLIVTLTIAAGVGGMVMRYSQDISGSIQNRGADLSRNIETDFSIVSDPDYIYQEINGENKLVVYVKNTGSNTIENDLRVIDVYIDGTYLSSENIEVLSVADSDIWKPSSVLKIVIDYSLPDGDHEVRVGVFNNSDSLKFRKGG